MAASKRCSPHHDPLNAHARDQFAATGPCCSAKASAPTLPSVSQSSSAALLHSWPHHDPTRPTSAASMMCDVCQRQDMR
eukprot:2727521-Rhodomonas_salina.1